MIAGAARKSRGGGRRTMPMSPTPSSPGADREDESDRRAAASRSRRAAVDVRIVS